MSDMLVSFSHGPANNTALVPKHMTWGEFVQRMKSPRVGDKDGSYLVRGGALRKLERGDENLEEAAVLVVDGDSGFDPETGEIYTATDPYTGKTKSSAPTIEEAAAAMDRLGYQYVLHTTHSYVPGVINKWRLYTPATMKDEDELGAAVDLIISQLHGAGCYVEANKESKVWSQAWFLPRCREELIGDFKSFSREEGGHLDVAAAVAVARSRAQAEQAVAKAQAPQTPRTTDGDSIIEAFNRAASLGWVRQMLEAQGYRFCGRKGDSYRYMAPQSESGTPGVNVFKGAEGDWCVYSHHGAHDPLSHTFCDPFRLYAIFNTGGDQKAAAKALAQEAGTGSARDPLAGFEEEQVDFRQARLEGELAAAKSAGPLFQRAAAFAGGWKPAEYLVDGMVQRGWCYSLTSPTGHGKTAVILNLAASIGAGLQFAGQETMRGRVGYFAAENPNDIQARWIGMTEHMSLDDPDVYFCPFTIDLATAFDQISAEAEAAGGFDLIVVDTSQAFFLGEDENSNTQMVAHAKAMRKLTQLPGNPCVIILAHPVKNPSKDNLLPRGGGGFLAEVDGNLTIWNDGDNITMSHQGKFRGVGFAPINFVLKVVQPFALKDAKGRQMPTVVAEHVTEDAFRKRVQDNGTDQDKVMIMLLSRKGDISIAEIAKTIGWVSDKGAPQKSKVARLLQQLRDAKLVVTNRFGKSVLTKTGKAEIGPKAKALGIDGAGEDEDAF